MGDHSSLSDKSSPHIYVFQINQGPLKMLMPIIAGLEIKKLKKKIGGILCTISSLSVKIKNALGLRLTKYF